MSGTATARSRHAPLFISERVQPGSRFFGYFRRLHSAVKRRAAQRLPRIRKAENPSVFNGFRAIYKNSHPIWMTVFVS